MHDRLMGDRRQAVPDPNDRRYRYARVPCARSGVGFPRGERYSGPLPHRDGRGAPIAIRCDQGTEFTAEALDQWAYTNKIELDFSRPGKPTDNAFIESFNASVRKELLNTRWFANLQEARRAARSWRREYNEDRPHRSLSNKTPQAFAASAKEARGLEKSHSPLA